MLVSEFHTERLTRLVNRHENAIYIVIHKCKHFLSSTKHTPRNLLDENRTFIDFVHRNCTFSINIAGADPGFLKREGPS